MKTPFAFTVSAGAALLLGLLAAPVRADILYVSNSNNDTIEKFTSGGVGSVFASSGLISPIGLAFDSAGNLYAANNGNNTIEKFTPGGVGSVFASSGLSSPLFLAFTNDAGVPLGLPPQGVSVVPEPSTWALFALGIAALPGLRRFGSRSGLTTV